MEMKENDLNINNKNHKSVIHANLSKNIYFRVDMNTRTYECFPLQIIGVSGYGITSSVISNFSICKSLSHKNLITRLPSILIPYEVCRECI